MWRVDLTRRVAFVFAGGSGIQKVISFLIFEIVTEDWIINVCSSLRMGSRHRERERERERFSVERRKDQACPSPSTVLHPGILDLKRLHLDIWVEPVVSLLSGLLEVEKAAPGWCRSCAVYLFKWLQLWIIAWPAQSGLLQIFSARTHAVSETTVINPSSPDHLLAASFSPFFLFRLSVTASLSLSLLFVLSITFICLIFPLY